MCSFKVFILLNNNVGILIGLENILGFFVP